MSIILTTRNPKNAENPVSNTGQASGLFNPYVPLRPSADALPTFPIHCLPPRLQAYVAAVAEHTQTPADMVAGVTLGVLATCLQGKVRVEGNPGYYEQTSQYVFIVANPGARKSAVIRAMTSIIEDYEQAHCRVDSCIRRADRGHQRRRNHRKSAARRVQTAQSPHPGHQPVRPVPALPGTVFPRCEGAGARSGAAGTARLHLAGHAAIQRRGQTALPHDLREPGCHR